MLVTTYIFSGMMEGAQLVDFHAPGAASTSTSTSTSDTIAERRCMALVMAELGGNQNSEGIANEQDFHKVAFTLPTWKAWAPGCDVEVAMTCYLPAAGVMSGMRIFSSQNVGLRVELPILNESAYGSGGGDNPGGATCSSQNIYPLASKAYPNWQQGDHANGGDRITHNKRVWQVHWRTAVSPRQPTVAGSLYVAIDFEINEISEAFASLFLSGWSLWWKMRLPFLAGSLYTRVD